MMGGCGAMPAKTSELALAMTQPQDKNWPQINADGLRSEGQLKKICHKKAQEAQKETNRICCRLVVVH
jgi:hypothetical protein